jgi:hypothetical protein
MDSVAKNRVIENEMSGTTFDFAVSAGYSLSSSYGVTIGYGLGVELEGVLKFPLGFLGIGSGLQVKGYEDYHWSDTTSQNRSYGQSINGSFETLYLPVRSSSYEKCVTVRFSSGFINNPKKISHFNKNLDSENLLKVMSRGSLICTGKKNKPISLMEPYFAAYQLEFGNQQNDPNLIRPFVLASRGHTELNRMVNFLQMTLDAPKYQNSSGAVDSEIKTSLSKSFGVTPGLYPGVVAIPEAN